MVRRSMVALLGAASVCLACSEAQPAVSRVQPGAVAKAQFDGEWYYLETVVDKPYTVSYTFVGEQSLLEKITWDIQRDYLIARRAYQWVAGSETQSATGTGETGAAVAIYAIQSHFDIRREYNEVTGEEINVVVENDTDRPWHERDYMRVDWSKNLITEPEFLAYQRLFDGVRAEPVAYHVEDPSHPDALRFETNAAGQLEYVDIVNRTFLEPQMFEWDDGEAWPVCWLDYQTHLDCASGEVAVRHSFLRVDPERDYQPEDYSGDRMARFGYFVNERPGYVPEYGSVEPARYRFINRFNIWQQSYVRDGSGARVACASDNACSYNGAGSVCDFHIARAERADVGACTIPYRTRAIRKVAYHVSESMPVDLLRDALFVINEWNATFVQTVGSLRENECLAEGLDPTACLAERARADAQQVFVLCHNPVIDGDDATCGEKGTVARIGDVRYSQLAWVPDADVDGGLLGYGPAAADPETGEIIMGNAFIYAAAVEEQATLARDVVALLNGDLDPSVEASGANVVDWVRRFEPGSRRTSRHAVDIDGSQASRVEAAIAPRRPRVDAAARERRPASRGEFRARARAAKHRIAVAGLLPSDNGRVAAARVRLAGSSLEAAMVHPEMLAAAGIGPDEGGLPGTIERASPLRGRSLSRLRALREMRRRLEHERCVLRSDFADDGVLGLARAIARAVSEGDGTIDWYGVTYTLVGGDGTLDYNAVREMFRHPVFTSTAIHEMGHTVGLRHNFSASYDSLNYPPEYWAARADGSMAPRAWDLLTDEEIDQRLPEYQHASVMDYGGNYIATDLHGLGHYDRAAIKMGYGDLVEVFTEAADPSEMAWVGLSQSWGDLAVLKPSAYEEGNDLTAYMYTEIPQLAGGIQQLEARADVPYTSLAPDRALEAEGIPDRVVDAQGRPMVPYRFCSEEFVDLFPDCLANDEGADPYETQQSLIDSYWNYYLVHSFRRQQLGFDIWPYWDNIYYRYFSELQYVNQDYLWQREWLEEAFAGDPSLDAFFERQDGFGAYTLGVGAAFNLFARVIATPEPGGYLESTLPDGSTGLTWSEWGDPDAQVDAFDGRYLLSSWDFNAGYYWVDQLDRVGFFYDKTLAIQTLLDPESYTIGKDVEADARSFSLSFHTTFPEMTEALLGGLLAEDWTAIAPRMGDDGALVYPEWDEMIDRSLDGTPVDPTADYSVQLYGAVLGMMLVPLSFDHGFIERARIFVDGGAEAVEVPADRRVEFVDPFTGLTFVAASFPQDGVPGGVETGLGARMLLHAQALADAGAVDALDEYMDSVSAVRTLSWQYGFGQ